MRQPDHPVITMWLAAGAPLLVPVTAEGVCALTGARGPVIPFRSVVSDNFSAWDRLPFRQLSGGFSPAACWSFRHRPLRARPHVLRDGALSEANPVTLRRTLGGALGPDDVVTVPIGRQKHVVPFARWGMVVTDQETVTWTAMDAERLALLARLRALGFGEVALAEVQPRWVLLRRLDDAERREVLRTWDELTDWRRHTIYLDIACRATRKPKEADND